MKKTMKKTIYAGLIIILLVSCGKNDTSLESPALNEKITLHNIEDISKKISDDKNIKRADIELYINALTRLGSFQDSIIGKTPLELIKSQEEFLKNRDILVLNNTSSRMNLFLQHTFNYDGIQFNDTDKNNKINILVFSIKNISDKTIKKVKGMLSFYTQDGQIIKIFNLSTAQEIKPNKEKPTQFSMSFKHDMNSERDNIIRTSRNLNAVWTPTLIEFTDNTKIIDKATLDKQF